MRPSLLPLASKPSSAPPSPMQRSLHPSRLSTAHLVVPPVPHMSPSYSVARPSSSCCFSPLLLSFAVPLRLLLFPLLLCCASSVAASPPCPSSTPSPSNPVGCQLYSFHTPVAAPTFLAVDSVAQPNTLILGSVSTNTLAAHYLNGTFYQNLTSSSLYPLYFAEAATVDTNGYVFISNYYSSYIIIFSPYPSYAFFSIIRGLSSLSIAGVSIITQGEYLFLTNPNSISAYRVTCNSSGVFSTQVGSSPALPYIFSSALSADTRQLIVCDPNSYRVTLYTLSYGAASVTFNVSRTYNTSNSALVQLGSVDSQAISTGGLLILMNEGVYGYSNATFLIMTPNGSSATGSAPIQTGIRATSVYYSSFLAITPTGSTIFILDVLGNSVVAFQGIDSGVAPLSVTSNTSCAAGAGGPTLPASSSTAPPTSLPRASSSSSSSSLSAAPVVTSSSSAFFNPCPSSTPSPSNPVGCQLYSFHTAIGQPDFIAVDSFALPNTLIIGSAVSFTVAVHYVSGSFYKNLTSSPVYPFFVPTGAAIDSDGFVYIPNLDDIEYTGGYILIFAPYPSYAYFSVLASIPWPLTVALSTIMQGEYLFAPTVDISMLGDPSSPVADLVAYRITCYPSGSAGQTVVGSFPELGNSVYQVAVHPATGQLLTFDALNDHLGLYTPTYTTTSVTLTVDHTYTSSNSAALAQVSGPLSVAVSTGGMAFILDDSGYAHRNLTFIIMTADGSSATGTRPIDSGIAWDSDYDALLSVTPTGSVIFLPDVLVNRVVAFQGIDSGIAPVTVTSQSSCAAGAGLTAPPSEPLLSLSGISITSLSVGQPTSVQLYGEHVELAVFALVGIANLSAELSAGVAAANLTSVPQVDMADLSATAVAVQGWASSNGYLVVYTALHNIINSSSSSSSSSLSFVMPALLSTGYHRLLVLSADPAPLNLLDWVFVVTGQCTTLLSVDGTCAEQCPEGCFCPGDGRCWEEPGWWTASEHIPPTRCVLPSSCPGALEAAPSADSPEPILLPDGSRNTARCAKEYRGRVCSDCAANYYHAGAACRFCGSTDAEQRASFAGLLIGAIVIVTIIATIICITSPFVLGSRVSALFKVQQVVLVGLTATQLLPSPKYDWLSQVFTDISIVNVDIGMFHPGCAIAALSYVEVFWATVLLVVGAALVFAVAAAVRAWLMVQHIHRDPKHGYWRWWRRTGDAVSISVPEPVVDDATEVSGVDIVQRRVQRKLTERVAVMRYVVSWPVHVQPDLSAGFRLGRSRTLEWWAVFRARLLQALLACGVLMYLRVTTVVLQMLHCGLVENEQGTGMSLVLMVDKRTLCYEGSHLPAAVIAWMLLFGFTLAFPILLCIALHRVHSDAYLLEKMAELHVPHAMSPSAAAAAQPSHGKTELSQTTAPISLVPHSGSHWSRLSSHARSESVDGGEEKTLAASQQRSPLTLRVDTEKGGEGDTAPVSASHSARAWQKDGSADKTAQYVDGLEKEMTMRYLLAADKQGQLTSQNARALDQHYLKFAMGMEVQRRFARYGYLLSSLRDERHHFALSDLTVNFVLALVVVLPSVLYVQVFVSAFTFFVYSVLVSLLWPYTWSSRNVYSIVTNVGLILQCLIGLSLIQARSTATKSAAANASAALPLQQRLALVTVDFLQGNLAYIATLVVVLLLTIMLGIAGWWYRTTKASTKEEKLHHIVGGSAKPNAPADWPSAGGSRQASGGVEMAEFEHKRVHSEVEPPAQPSSLRLTQASSEAMPLSQTQVVATPLIPTRPSAFNRAAVPTALVNPAVARPSVPPRRPPGGSSPPADARLAATPPTRNVQVDPYADPNTEPHSHDPYAHADEHLSAQPHLLASRPSLVVSPSIPARPSARPAIEG